MAFLDFLRKRTSSSSPPSERPRLGVPILMQQEFRTNLVVVFVHLDAEEGMQSFHQSISGFNPEALTIDDADEINPVYFFDVGLPKTKVPVDGGRYALIFSVFGVKGLEHPSLQVLCARGHEFLLVASAKDAKAAVHQFRASLPKEKQAQLHVCGPGAYVDALKQVTQDVLVKSHA